MDDAQARDHLLAEQDRLARLREGFEAEHLHDESVDDSAGELSHADQHAADVASETFEREKDLSILDQVEAELDEVERALGRLDDGSDGTCEACHAPIGDDRLEAMPAARFCVAHQEQAEGVR